MTALPPDVRAALPEACAVRLIDLDVKVGGLIAVDEDGFVNIYLNARLSRDAQLRALRHELTHYLRGDFYSDADIREVEAIDGQPIEAPAEVFDPAALKRVGRGLYRPTGQNLERASADIAALAEGLSEAVRMFDVLQTPPWLQSRRLEALAADLSPDDIAFVAWQPPGEALPAVMQLCRGDGDALRGAVYYDAEGRADNALVTLECRAEHAFRVTIDLRRRAGRIEVFAIYRQIDEGGMARLY